MTYVTTVVPIEAQVDAVLASPAACRRVLRELAATQDSGAFDDSRWNGVAALFTTLRSTAQARPRRPR